MIFSFSLDNQFNNTEQARMFFTPKSELLTQLKKSNFTSNIIIALTVIVASLLLSRVAAFVPSGKFMIYYLQNFIEFPILDKRVDLLEITVAKKRWMNVGGNF
jgi:hypothetical protein